MRILCCLYPDLDGFQRVLNRVFVGCFMRRAPWQFRYFYDRDLIASIPLNDHGVVFCFVGHPLPPDC